MSGFKVACIWRECKRVPEWVSRTLESHGIEFVEQNCKSSEQVLELGADADVIWVMGSGRLIPAGMLPMCTRCGAIICSGSGTDSVPVSAATKLGIIVANTPDATAIPVAEHAIALLLAVCRLIPFHDQKLRAGVWSRLDPVPLIIHNKTAGLVGFGRISRGVAERLTPFGMRLLAYDPFVDDNEMAAADVEPADWTELLSESDFISVHVPLLESTHHLIGEAELKQMKPTSVLINTCRGPVVDTAALATALKRKAGLRLRASTFSRASRRQRMIR